MGQMIKKSEGKVSSSGLMVIDVEEDYRMERWLDCCGQNKAEVFHVYCFIF